MLTSAKWAGITLGAGLLLGGATTAKADCRDRVRNEERDLARAERHFGPWSRQAGEERNELFRARQNSGGWGNRWFVRDRDRDRGWDRDDHRHRRDRDHDRDDRGRRRDRDRGRDRD